MVTATTQTPAVLCLESTHSRLLRKVVYHRLVCDLPDVVRPIFQSPVNRELIIGLIGMRGEGKSASAAYISLLRFLLDGIPVWSNINIKCKFKVTDDEVKPYGLKRGGSFKVTSQPLDREALLSLDKKFINGCIVGDEFNLQYVEVRRTMSNVNLQVNHLCQQLRHFGTSLIYTVIDEMFVDTQVRSMTDVFIKCEDTALSVDGLMRGATPGVNFKWLIYPMSPLLYGRENCYHLTHKPLPPVYLAFKPFWGIYDTKQIQASGSRSYNPEKPDATENYKWLEPLAVEMYERGDRYIPQIEIWSRPEVKAANLSTRELNRRLRAFNIYTTQKYHDGAMRMVYELPEEREVK